MMARWLAWALVAAAATAGFAAEAAGDGSRTLHGLYTSGFQSGPQRVRAVFTPDPAARDRWSVVFHFRWTGDERQYSGHARGNLVDGLLHGRVQDEGRQRTFTFRCEFDKKRRCKGKHAEVVRTGEHETGTITLKE